MSPELPQLREIKLTEAEQKAAREKARVEYIIGVVEGNEDALRDVFVPDGTDEAEVPELLYTKVVDSLKWLESESINIIGVTISLITSHNAQNSEEPLVKLGWAVYQPAIPGADKCPEGEAFPYILHPTETGIEIVNSLRAAQGYVTVQEQYEINRISWDQGRGSVNAR